MKLFRVGFVTTCLLVSSVYGQAITGVVFPRQNSFAIVPIVWNNYNNQVSTGTGSIFSTFSTLPPPPFQFPPPPNQFQEQNSEQDTPQPYSEEMVLQNPEDAYLNQNYELYHSEDNQVDNYEADANLQSQDDQTQYDQQQNYDQQIMYNQSSNYGLQEEEITNQTNYHNYNYDQSKIQMNQQVSDSYVGDQQSPFQQVNPCQFEGQGQGQGQYERQNQDQEYKQNQGYSEYNDFGSDQWSGQQEGYTYDYKYQRSQGQSEQDNGQVQESPLSEVNYIQPSPSPPILNYDQENYNYEKNYDNYYDDKKDKNYESDRFYEPTEPQNTASETTLNAMEQEEKSNLCNVLLNQNPARSSQLSFEQLLDCFSYLSTRQDQTNTSNYSSNVQTQQYTYSDSSSSQSSPQSTAVAQASAYSQGQWVKDVYLGLHNEYRSRHCLSWLEWDMKLVESAKQYAQGCTWGHTPELLRGLNQGENLYASGPMSLKKTPEEVMSGWYDEIALFDYNNPTFAEETGHFTQIVWNGTTSVGCYIHTCPEYVEYERKSPLTIGGDWEYVVCRYDPPGNIINFMASKVPPPCQ